MGKFDVAKLTTQHSKIVKQSNIKFQIIILINIEQNIEQIQYCMYKN